MNPEASSTQSAPDKPQAIVELDTIAAQTDMSQEQYDITHASIEVAHAVGDIALKHEGEVSDTASQVLEELAIAPEEEDSTETAIVEATRRQVDMDQLYAKQVLDGRAAQENWSEEKYQQALSELQSK